MEDLSGRDVLALALQLIGVVTVMRAVSAILNRLWPGKRGDTG